MVTRVNLASVRVLKVIVRERVTNRPGRDGQARKQEDQSGSARRRSDRHPVTVALLLWNWKKGPFDRHRLGQIASRRAFELENLRDQHTAWGGRTASTPSLNYLRSLRPDGICSLLNVEH